MSLEQEKLFRQLLEQIGLHHKEEYFPYFEKGKVQKVTVHRASKMWQFDFQFEDILPFEVYQNLEESLRISFASIATIKMTIQTVNPKLTTEKLEHYWSSAVKNSQVSSPICDQPFRDQFPIVNDRKIHFIVENDIVKEHLKNMYLPPVEEAYQKMGFLLLESNLW